MTSSPSDLLKARASALAFLSRRDHARAELLQKLQRKGFSDPAVEQVVQEMIDHGYLDDARFAAGYARMRAARGYGPVKIRQELKNRGVAGQLIDTALAELDIDFQALCQQVHARKFGANPPADRKGQARRQRFLYQRGFDAECIRQVVPAPEWS